MCVIVTTTVFEYFSVNYFYNKIKYYFFKQCKTPADSPLVRPSVMSFIERLHYIIISTRRMFGIETASRACKITIEGQRSTVGLRAFRLKTYSPRPHAEPARSNLTYCLETVTIAML